MLQERFDCVLAGASLLNMDTPDHPDLRAMREAGYSEWFLREVDEGIAAAGRGKFAEHLDVRKLIDDRCPG